MATLFASSSNPSGNNNSPHDVFINHRGPDTKLSIASHLYSRLTPHGLRVFLDKEELEKGDFVTSQIAAAIREASVHIAIFSPGYADSEWCLDELLLMLESMESGRSIIIPIFYHVKPADLRWTQKKSGVYAAALTRLKKKRTHQAKRPRYDSGVIKKWRDALSKVSYIDGFDLEGAYSNVEWRLVEEVVQRVLEKVERPPLDMSKYLTGLDKKVKEFEDLLQQQSEGIRVMGIVGLGGVGKTTFAKQIFNRLRSNYKHSCFLFDIRENSLTTLQSDLMKDLSQSNVQIRSTAEGKGLLRKNISSKVALIILDNVDHAQQLEALLLPAKDALHSSSLILVTSRDRQLLINQDIQESSIYKLECLSQRHSQELFCLHAFGQPYPVAEFSEVVKKFLGVCQGLPLSLKVLGALLRGKKDLEHWEAQLRKISKILPDDIQSRLHISYDSLDHDEKQIFLDIACFFIGEEKDTAITVWDESGWEGGLGLHNLENKCLIEIDRLNRISMHDHLRDMGRRIGEKNSPHRLWRLTDNLLQDLPDILSVRGINMIKASAENNGELANRLRGLELVKAEGNCFDESMFRSLQSPHLIWLRWERCPYSSLPSWIPMDSLRVLQLIGSSATTLKTLCSDNDIFQAPLQLRKLGVYGYSEIEMLPDSFGELENLQHIDLSHCSKIERLPDSFGKLKNLQHINLSGCSKIERLPDSFGELKKLQHIDLCGCSRIERLPDSFGELKNLQHIDLYGCSKIERLPHSFGELKSLQHINLSRCSKIERLPDSFGELENLQHIDLSHCSKIERLPDSFGELKNLQHINLSGCSKIEKLPVSFGELKNLQHINLTRCSKIERLPDSFGELKNLQHINLLGCSKIERLPNSFRELKNLQHIYLLGCSKIERLPDSFGELKKLQHIELQGCSKIKRLPKSFGELKNLQHIDLSHCDKIKRLPDSLCELKNLQHIDLSLCSKIKRLPNSFGELKNLQHINLSMCFKIKRLPDSFGELKNLQHIDLSHCSKIKKLPNSFGELKNLQHIDLSDCSKIERLPNSFCNLTQLQHLTLNDCSKLNIFPETFGKISTLEFLDLSLCPKIEVCPPQVAHNRLLQILFLIDTNLKELPSYMGELSHLQVLHFGSEWLETLPTSLGHLRGLQELVLSNCRRLKCLPDSIRLLTQLRELKIKNSGVESLPPCVMELNSLERLEIEDCPLKELPFRKVEGGTVLNKMDASILKWKLRLKSLKLVCMEISEVSFSQDVCPNLQHLDIDRCSFLVEVGALPTTLINLKMRKCCALREIGGLCGLEKLEKFELVDCDKVEDLTGLERSTCLKELNLANCCELKEVTGLKHLKLLRRLNTSGCGKLQNIEGLARLTELVVLNVENCCELKEIAGLEHLKWLRELNVSGCGKVQSIMVPAQLTRLGMLNVANGCELKEIRGLEHLKSLWKLNASGCGKLQSIEGLAQLTKLEVLQVENCYDLKEIPGLEHLMWLRELNASGCGKLQSIEGLAQHRTLEVLNVENCCELKEIPGLEHLKWLRELNASGCGKLQSIKGLAKLTELEVLKVENAVIEVVEGSRKCCVGRGKPLRHWWKK